MKFKSIISLLLVVAAATVFSFRSLAFVEATKTEASADKKNSSTADKKISSTDNGSALTGTLTTEGYVTINGNEARTGATITNGDTVATGPDSDATIDLGPLGRIQLRPDTRIKLTLAEKNCQILVEQCGSLTHFVPAGVLSQARRAEPGLMEVAVLPGEARVTSKGRDGEEMVKGGENRVFETLDSVAANGETIYTLNCCDCAAPAGAPFLPVGFWGLVAAGTTGVVVVTGGDDPVSPIFP
ncbi:MAG TPA: hypothetical protein VID27_20650 [Blastocatellia bacterium]|jgi:hypothetical protein